jgi:hypothetical protein
MTLYKFKDDSFLCKYKNKILFACSSIQDCVILLLRGVEIDKKEVENALVDMLLNDNDIAEFGINKQFLYSTKG